MMCFLVSDNTKYIEVLHNIMLRVVYTSLKYWIQLILNGLGSIFSIDV